MKNTFNGWSNIGNMSLDAVTNLIVTGKTSREAMPDTWIFKYIGDKNTQLNILDFGCGIGRNTFGLSKYSSKWSIVGYDNESMLDKTTEFWNLNYGGSISRNIWFQSEWDRIVKYYKFDVIFCNLVIQHIYEDAIKNYIQDFKKISPTLMVTGRRFNDDVNHRSNWEILEESGLKPTIFKHGDVDIVYNPIGNPEDHNIAIYKL